MASSRRTSPAQLSRQEEGTQESNEGIVEGDLRMQKEENQRDGEKRRELSEITQKHLERVINTMILSSAGSSHHSAESAPMNSLVSQLTEKSIEGTEHKQDREKQVIVYNYYINDGREGWKQVEKSEISPNVLDNKVGGESAENPPSRLGNDTHGYSGEISPGKPGHNIFNAPSGKEEETRHPDKNRNNVTEAKTEPRRFYEQEMEAQNMSPPPTYNPNYPPPNRYSGYQETTAMLDCIRQLQLTMQQHVLTNSKQAEYHMSQNADLFMEMAKGQRRRDLDPAVMAIPTFMGQEPEKCLDWINRIRNICSQAGCPLRQELMNKSEPMVQNFIGNMREDWTDEEVIEEILKYFSDIPTPAYAITKLRALVQGEEEAIVTYNQKYRTLVERVEKKAVEKIDSYVELEQYLGSIIFPIRKSIQNNIYWKSKHAPKTLGEAMKKAEELYMKHIYVTEEQTDNVQNTSPSVEVTINEVNSMQKLGQYSQGTWKSKNYCEISPKQSNFQHRPRGEDNRELPRGSYTQIMVNPTQLSDKEFAAWIDRLVEARRNRQENKPWPYRQFRKPLLQNRGEAGELPQEHLKNKIKPAEELDTKEIMSHMRCELVNIEEAVDMYNLDVEECRSA